MAVKPTYEELEQKVQELELESVERKQTEKALRESEGRFKKQLETIDSMGVGIFIVDRDFHIRHMNKTMIKWFGDPTGLNCHKSIAGLDSPCSYCQIKSVISSGKTIKYSPTTPDGRSFDITCSPVRNSDGSISKMEIIRDITEQKLTEEALRDSEEHLQSVFRAAPTGIGVVSDRVLNQVNERICEMTGYSEEELIGQNARVLYPSDEDYEYVGRKKYKQIRDHDTGTVETRWKRKDGFIIDVLLSSTPMDLGDLSKGVTFTALDITERRKTEAELQLKNLVFETAITANSTADNEGVLTHVNNAFIRTWGYENKEEAVGKSISEFFKFEDEGKKIITALNEAGKWEGEYTALKKDGTTFAAYGLGTIIKDESGNAIGYQSSVLDISEQRLAQEENLKRQQFLESVFYHAPDAIVTLDSEHRVVDWNRGAVNMFGYTPEEAIGVQLDDLVAPGESHIEAGSKTRQVLSGQRVEAFETVRYRKDGTPLLVIAAGSAIMIDGVVKGVVAVYTDITDIVQAEDALRESEQKFRALVQESPFGIALIGKDGRYQYANPEFNNIFGYTIEDIPTSAEWFQKAYPDKAYRDTVVQTWKTDLKQTAAGQPHPRMFTVTCKDGSRKDINFRPVTMENMNHFVIYEDITEKTKLERQLQQTQKFEAVGTLAGGIAHDFNNLLMGIQGRASLMSVELEPSHPHSEHIKAIEDYIRSATDLTKQLLGFARGGKYEVRPIDVNELLLESSTMFGRTKKEIRIHTKLQNPPPVIAADRRQIEQVLLNLYINAWQAMPDGGELYLETKIVALDDAYCKPYQAKPGRYAKVSVTDTGIGMDESIYRRIFDPFFTTKEKARGTGLGLSSAYGIIKNHAGIIAVYSEVGQGTTFNIYLPVSQAAAYRDVPTETDLVKGSETVLLVDDEDMIIKVAQAMLEKLGYRVVVAKDGKQAVDTVKRKGNEIDLVILDLIMPGIKGGKAFDLIHEIQPEMPVILSSGYSLNGQANDIMQRGCNGFIQKPFNISELSQKVQKILNEAKSPTK